MPADSLKNLLGMFPYFFDKSETSNFFKSQSVTNKQFQDIYNSLFDVVESFHLQKRCLIWKEQTEPYEYSINFVANYPRLKSVNCYKNDELIYNEHYNLSDNVTSFIYSHEDTTLNDIGDLKIIPTDTFKMDIETYDEYLISKGFPENDNIQGDIYDHDKSLDILGVLHNIPRKKYIPVDDILLPATEPPYNNRLSEDDYHYMNRILNYLLKVHTLPLPVLEIWKLYGITATMENREKYLLKLFDETKHPFDETTGLVGEWEPEPWEHQDKFCDYNENLGEYFFVKVSTNIPVKNQDVLLYFQFLNCLAEPLTGNYCVDVYLEDTLIVENHNGASYKLDNSLFNQLDDTTFTVFGKHNGEIISSEEIIIRVRGCNNANWYVSTNGDDSNDGKTVNTPFKTITKAVRSVQGSKNLIAVGEGTYSITAPIDISENCTILGCGETIIENNNSNRFFTIPVNQSLILQDLTLKNANNSHELSTMEYENNNPNGNPIFVITYEDLS